MPADSATAPAPSKRTGPKGPKPSDARTDPATGASPVDPADKVPEKAEPEFEICGHNVNTANGDKPCVKPKGHDSNAALMEEWGSGHASRIQKRKEYETPDDDVFASFGEVPHDETADYGGGVGAQERDEKQLIVDGHVKQNYDNWVKAGKPKLGFNDSIKAGLASRYMMMPKDEEAMRHRIRSAARFHGVGVRIAKLKKHESGKYMLYWTVQDLQPHQRKKDQAQPSAEETVAALLDAGYDAGELAEILAKSTEDAGTAGDGAAA